MEIDFKSNSDDIIDGCLKSMQPKKVVIVDSHSKGYLKRRQFTDKLEENKLSNSTIDGPDYYDDLMKES